MTSRSKRMTGFALTRRMTVLGGGAALAASCAPTISGAQQVSTGVWRPGPSLPEPVQEIYPAALNGAIHLAGGFVAQNGQITGPTARHVSWSPGESAWSERAPLPEPRHHPNLVGHDGVLLALGGFRADSAEAVWVMQDQSWAYDPASDAWTALAPAPGAHAETVAAALIDGVHVVGGRSPAGTANATWQDHVDSDRHWVFDLAENRWREVATAPRARNSAACAVIGDALHVVGGRTVGGGNESAHDVYDPAADGWRSAAPMPQAQGGLAAASVDGRLYAFGGEWFSPVGSGVYAECWVYDPVADAWSAISDDWTPRHGLGAVALNGEIYVIGGARLPSGADTSELVEIYVPA